MTTIKLSMSGRLYLLFVFAFAISFLTSISARDVGITSSASLTSQHAPSDKRQLHNVTKEKNVENEERVILVDKLEPARKMATEAVKTKLQRFMNHIKSKATFKPNNNLNGLARKVLLNKNMVTKEQYQKWVQFLVQALLTAGKKATGVVHTKLQQFTNQIKTKVNTYKVNKDFNKLVGEVPLDKNMFKHEQYQKWVQSVRKAYGPHETQIDQAMTSALTSQYGTRNVVRAILAAKDDASTKTAAGKLEEALLTSWMDEGKSIEDVFILLQLDERKTQLFGSPELNMWLSYAQLRKEEPNDWLLERLKTRLTHDEVEATLSLSKQGVEIGSLAEQLKPALLKKWNQEKETKTIEDAFASRNLDIRKLESLETPELKEWFTELNKLGKAPHRWLVQRFSKSHADARLAQMIHNAKNSDDTSIKALALEMEEVLRLEWKESQKSVADVFDILMLSHKGFLKSPLLSTWVSYVELLNQNPYQLLLDSLIRTQTTDVNVAMLLAMAAKNGTNKDIVKEIQRLQRLKWYEDGETGVSVFKLLEIPDKNDIFRKLLMSTWVSFMKLKTSKDNLVANQENKKHLADEIAAVLHEFFPGYKLVDGEEGMMVPAHGRNV